MAQRRKTIARPSYSDPVSTIMASLLPLHSAATQEWLVDAAATAAERALNAAYAFVFLEDQAGQLEYRAPASDLRRRSIQRAIDALGADVFRARIDPGASPQLEQALDTARPVQSTVQDLFTPLAGEERAAAAASSLAVEHACVAPLEIAGERIGAFVALVPEPVDLDHMKLLAEHIACATVNLRNAQAGREQGVIDIVRSVFDARKLESELQRELSRAQRYGREVAIAVVEATNLRLLRERFGAFLTERLLQRLGEALAQQSREIDVIGAYKESGYTMILTEAKADGAELAARRLLAAAMSVKLEGDEVPGLELHLVAGWAAWPADGATSDSLFTAAERRMYGSASQVA